MLENQTMFSNLIEKTSVMNLKLRKAFVLRVKIDSINT